MMVLHALEHHAHLRQVLSTDDGSSFLIPSALITFREFICAGVTMRIEHVLISDSVAAKLERKHHLTDIEVYEALTSELYPQVVRRFRRQALYQVYGRAASGRYIFCLVWCK
ncbi:MAG: hypothetical protein ACK4HB_08480 [Candidatus Bipolaricaulia bacterium]